MYKIPASKSTWTEVGLLWMPWDLPPLPPQTPTPTKLPVRAPQIRSL